MTERTFSAGFRYRHRNPYHERLAAFAPVVLRDHEAEAHRGRWNRDVFGREAPLLVEIGSGYGRFMLEFCGQNPHVNFVGIDYKFKRSFNLAKRIARSGLPNIRFLRARGERIDFQFGEGEVDRIFYFFPDPWPKKRHHKKRPFGAPFLAKARRVLSPSGDLLVKTDHDGLMEWMLEAVAESGLFTAELVSRDLRREHPGHFLCSFTTKFEDIFLAQGTPIKGLVLRAARGGADGA